jgi:hypothetical protein
VWRVAQTFASRTPAPCKKRKERGTPANVGIMAVCVATLISSLSH